MKRAVAVFATLSLIPAVVRAADADAKGDIPTPKFERQVIDDKVQIGYGVAIGDVDGDGKPDILLADKKQFVWYRNGDWKRFVMAEDLTPQDNVCIAARDIDGSGKVSVAVGAGWNPSETSDPTKSGAVFYLIRPKDPTQHWEPVRLHHEVTTHRMQWVKSRDGKFRLVVLPLHGLANKDGKGAGVRILAYEPPDDPHADWTTQLIDDTMHMTHNFEVVGDAIYVAGREGIKSFRKLGDDWQAIAPLTNAEMQVGAGEVRGCSGSGRSSSGRLRLGFGALTAIEPMHGNKVTFYSYKGQESSDMFVFERQVLDDTLAEGHALGCADFLGLGRQQIVAGWRAPNKEKKVGIKMYVPLDDKGEKWQTHVIDDNQMACEDLKVADLDGDGRPDIIASGRATHNLVIYWNRTPNK